VIRYYEDDYYNLFLLRASFVCNEIHPPKTQGFGALGAFCHRQASDGERRKLELIGDRVQIEIFYPEQRVERW